MKRPITEKDVGILHDCDHHKFREVRSKSKEEEKERYHSDKRYKERKELEYTIHPVGSELIVVMMHNPRSYMLVEVLDIYIEDWPVKKYTEIEYYCIVKKISNKIFARRIGHLFKLSGRTYDEFFKRYDVIDADPSKIKWLKSEEFL